EKSMPKDKKVQEPVDVETELQIVRMKATQFHDGVRALADKFNMQFLMTTWASVPGDSERGMEGISVRAFDEQALYILGEKAGFEAASKRKNHVIEGFINGCYKGGAEITIEKRKEVGDGKYH